MAIKFWEELINEAHIEAQNKRDLYNQTYVHEFDLNPDWTTAAIHAFVAQEMPEIRLSANTVKEFVDFFHTRISQSRVKKKVTDRDFKAGAYYADLKADMSGSKRQQGVILEASYYHLITNPGNTGLNRISDVRLQTEKRIMAKLKDSYGHDRQKLGNRNKNYLGDHLQFAHGEGRGTPITTVSGMSLGQTSLDKMNSATTGNELLKRGIENAGVVQKASVEALRDMIKMEFEVDMKIDADTQGDTSTYDDRFIVHGAMKIQSENFASNFDMAADSSSGVGKKYMTAVRRALLKKFTSREISQGDFFSSPKAKHRMKAQATKQMVTSMSKVLKKNPQFVVLGHDKLSDFKKKQRKKIKTKNTKGKTGVRRGTKARKTTPSKGLASVRANPIALKELINAALPAELLKQMHPPALRNRTGRFRQSAEVTNVLVGPRGGVEAEYTYMRDPYETFEPGGNMGSRGRDPRKLIGGSVREIAMRLTGNRFIRTRRV